MFSTNCTDTDGDGTAMYCPPPEIDLTHPTRRRRQVLAYSPSALPAEAKHKSLQTYFFSLFMSLYQ